METVWRFDKAEGTLFIHQDFVDYGRKDYMNLLSHLILPEWFVRWPMPLHSTR